MIQFFQKYIFEDTDVLRLTEKVNEFLRDKNPADVIDVTFSERLDSVMISKWMEIPDEGTREKHKELERYYYVFSAVITYLEEKK